jgi:hypothetical protein
LPIAFRPHPDEALSSWLSRTAAVYGFSLPELLVHCGEWGRSARKFMDVQLNAMDSFKLECLLGCAPERILTCTVEGACPELLPQWVSQVPPWWNITERLTVLKPGFSPAICAYCLLEDLENDQSQYLRLRWYCALTTVCPVHRMPMQQCCHDFIPVSRLHGHHRSSRARLYCGACFRALDERSCSIDFVASTSLANFEGTLRSAISSKYVSVCSGRIVPGPSVVRFIEDLVWALMQPLSGTPYRILHAMQRNPFRVPNGFNTPVQVANWLSFAPLAVRRSLLAVIAGVLQPESTLWPADFGSFGVGTKTFWRLLRERLSSAAIKELSVRAEHWHPILCEEAGFY